MVFEAVCCASNFAYKVFCVSHLFSHFKNMICRFDKLLVCFVKAERRGKNLEALRWSWHHDKRHFAAKIFCSFCCYKGLCLEVFPVNQPSR